MSVFGKGGGEWYVNVALGNDITLNWDVLDENGDPYDWTNATVTATTQGSQNWTVGALVNGELTLSLSDTKTTALGVGVFPQNLTVVKNGDTSTWLAGELKVRPVDEPIPQRGSLRVVHVIHATTGQIRLAGCAGTGGGGGGSDGGNIDGGAPDSVYGGTTAIDGGTP